jgi:hypothetical protein
VDAEGDLYAYIYTDKYAYTHTHTYTQAGSLRLKSVKVRRTEDVDAEGDEQVIMAALQKHATALNVPLRLNVRVVQAVDVPATDEGGTSDPYVILTCGGMKKRSKVCNVWYLCVYMCILSMYVCMYVCVYVCVCVCASC